MLAHHKRFILLMTISIASLGLFSTISQIIMFREFLVVFYGNELSIGIIFSSWLLGVSLGAGIGGKLSSRFPKIRTNLYLFSLIFFIMSFLLPVQVGILRNFRSLLNIPAGEFLPITSVLYAALVTIVPLSFTIGLIFPFTCNIFKGLTKEKATDIGTVYILESIGALIGGVIFTFILVSRVETYEIIAIFDILIFVNLVFLSLYFKHNSYTRCVKISCVMFAVLTFYFLLQGNISSLDRYLVNLRWNSFNSNIKLLDSFDSKYQNIVVGKQADQFNVYINGQYDFSFPDQYGYAQDAHLIMTQHPNPERVLLIGGGLGGLIREVLKHPVKELDYLELDPELIKITKKYLQSEDLEALRDNRLTMFNTDGRYFIKKLEDKKYDLILSNTPDPSTALLNRFYTYEFFKEINDVLKNDGVFVTGISSALNYMSEDLSNYTGSVYSTLKNVFPDIKVTPGQDNFFICGNKQSGITLDIDTLAKRFVKRDIKSEYFTEFNFYTLLEPEQVAFVQKQYNNITNFMLNTDSHPVTYFFNLVLWDQFAGGKFTNVLRQMEKIKISFFLVPAFLFFILRFIYLQFKSKKGINLEAGNELINEQIKKTAKFNSLMAIACIGFAGIAVEIILIFTFQNLYGYIYEKIGMIIAMFMFGVAFGGYFGNKFITATIKKNRWLVNNMEMPGKVETVWAKNLLVIEIVIILFVLLIPLVLKVFTFSSPSSQIVFFLLIAGMGLLTGLGFPIGSKLYLQAEQSGLLLNNQGKHSRNKMSIVAGLIDSFDHFGSLVGALLTGIIFVPLFGVNESFIIVAVLNAVSALLLWRFIMQKQGIERSCK